MNTSNNTPAAYSKKLEAVYKFLNMLITHAPGQTTITITKSSYDDYLAAVKKINPNFVGSIYYKGRKIVS